MDTESRQFVILLPAEKEHIHELTGQPTHLSPLTEGYKLREKNRLSSLPSSTVAVLFYAASTVCLLLFVLRKVNFSFTYTLDDPYIHLALSERIRHGLYGLNMGEPVSPSSSVLWPFLFVPFAGTSVMTYMPLVVNLLCCGWTAWLLGRFVDRYVRRKEDAVRPVRRLLLVCLLILSCNLIALPFTGMEHSLEVLLCACCAYGTVCAIREHRVPSWSVAAAVLVPSVRYEGILCTATLAVALWVIRRRVQAMVLVPLSLLGPVAFSFYLHKLGLPWFPISVLVKAGVRHPSGTILYRGLVAVSSTMQDPERMGQFGLMIALSFLAWRNRRTMVGVVGGAAACACLVQVIYGPLGWGYRYEIYMVTFAMMIALAMDHVTPSPDDPEISGVPAAGKISGYLLLAVGAIAMSYAPAIRGTANTARSTYRQHGQMARFTHDFYTGSVAVNDLGMVAYRRDPRNYVLDLAALGSYDVFRSNEEPTARWLTAMTKRRRVTLAIIYPEWFQSIPHDWKPVAKMCNLENHPGPYIARVMFYATPDGDEKLLVQKLIEFKSTLPRGVLLDIAPKDQSTQCQESPSGVWF